MGKKKSAALCVSKGCEQGLQVLFLTLPRISRPAVGRSPNISADHLQNKDSNIFPSQQDVFRRVLGRHSLQWWGPWKSLHRTKTTPAPLVNGKKMTETVTGNFYHERTSCNCLWLPVKKFSISEPFFYTSTWKKKWSIGLDRKIMQINYINGWNSTVKATYRFSLILSNTVHDKISSRFLWQRSAQMMEVNAHQSFPSRIATILVNWDTSEKHLLGLVTPFYTVLKFFSYSLWEIIIGGSSSGLLDISPYT